MHITTAKSYKPCASATIAKLLVVAKTAPKRSPIANTTAMVDRFWYLVCARQKAREDTRSAMASVKGAGKKEESSAFASVKG